MKFSGIFVLSALVVASAAQPLLWQSEEEHAAALNLVQGTSLEILDEEGLFKFWKKVKSAAHKAGHWAGHEAKVVGHAVGPVVKQAAKDAIAAKAGAIVTGILG